MNHQPRQTSVCVVGSINVDTVFRLSHIPTPGETVLALHKSVGAGGKGANQAVAAASLGSRVSFIGCIGDDREGAFSLEILSARGVDVTSIRTLTGAATGTATVLVSPDGENVVVVNPGANGHLDPHAIEAYLSSHEPKVVLAQLETNFDAVLAAAKNSESATFILNPAPMPAAPAAVANLLEYTDVLVPNRAELGLLAGTATPSSPADLDRCVESLDFNGRVIVTLGREGVDVYEAASPRRGVLIDPERVDAIDTTGAGDAFCGALGHYIASGDNLHTAVFRANRVAAWSTTTHGAQLDADVSAALVRNT